MEIEKYLAEKKPLIDREIEKVLPRKISQKWLEHALGKAAFAYDAETIGKSMAEPIWEYLDRGGKRWRPGLTLLCCEAVGGKEKDALPFAPLIELVHNGTIMIDDIEDDSKERRGKLCTHLIYGTDIACNDSNALYFLGLITLYRNTQKLSTEKRNKIYNLYSEEMLRVCTGQAMDIWWHKGKKAAAEGTISPGFLPEGKKADIKEEHYLQMVVYKTGVLARFAAKLGAILGNGSQRQIEALGKFGEALGVGFQIQDDILELTGEEFKKGKGSPGGDIHEGKRTLLVIKTLEKASADDKRRLLEILDSHPTDAETINEAIEIIKKCGAIEFAREKANRIVESAWKKIDSVIPKSKAKELLHNMALYCTERKI